MPDWTYKDGTYFDEDGDPVPRKTVLALLATLTTAQADRLRALAQQRADDTLDTPAWHRATAAAVKTGVVAGAALAVGGIARLDRAWTAARVATQLDYLAGFVAAVTSGDVAPTTPSTETEPAQPSLGFLQRAEAYSGAVHSTFMAGTLRQAKELGHDEEKNVLEAGAAHCDSCLAETEQDWVPIGTLSVPGERDCVWRCRCHVETRQAETGERVLADAAQALAQTVAALTQVRPPSVVVVRKTVERDEDGRIVAVIEHHGTEE